MAVNYSAALKTTRMTAVKTLIDANAGGVGYLIIGTSAFDGTTSATTGLIAKIALETVCGTVSGDTLTFDATDLSGTVVAAGPYTAALAEIWDRDTATDPTHVIVSGLTVGLSAANIILSVVADIPSGTVIKLDSATITHS